MHGVLFFNILSNLFQSKGKKRQVGWFPASYVKLMESGGAGAAAAEKSHPATAAAPAEPHPDPIESAPKFRALFAYAGQHEDELSFQVNIIWKWGSWYWLDHGFPKCS